MALELKLNVKLGQQLVMTPQLQQAIKLLQLSRLDLVTTIQQELVENPVLEEVLDDEPTTPQENGLEPSGENAAPEPEPVVASEEAPSEPSTEDMVSDVEWDDYMDSRPQTSLSQGHDDRPPIEANLSLGLSLAEHLLWQLGFADLDEKGREIGTLLIGNLNDDGYLDESLAAIAQAAGVDEAAVDAVRRRIQEFDPIGVASLDLADCLLVQMRVLGLDHPLAKRIIERHMDLLQRKDYRGIARIEETTIEDVSEAAKVIGGFEPRPGRQFASEDPIYITPDIFVHKIGDEYHVLLNEDGMPKLRVSQAYREVLNSQATGGKETREYVRDRLRSAVWLIKSIHQRQRTIVRVMESILRFQRDFFERGPEFLRPLNLRDVADDIGMHESTVSRVTSSKYVQTPHGLFELKFFFNSSIRTGDGDGIASESVKEKIAQMIRNEDPRKPLSDQRIAELLGKADIHIARRTVTKYREALRILSSTQRREIG
jgi:RNA polymerase sigma-54 factor